MVTAYDNVFATLDSSLPESAAYKVALSQLKEIAETGDLEAGEYLAELCALPGPHYDPRTAYIWYHITLSQQGYTTAFLDTNLSPPFYCGSVGDFRNESVVGELVVALGYQQVQLLDAQARSWLATKNLTAQQR